MTVSFGRPKNETLKTTNIKMVPISRDTSKSVFGYLWYLKLLATNGVLTISIAPPKILNKDTAEHKSNGKSNWLSRTET